MDTFLINEDLRCLFHKNRFQSCNQVDQLSMYNLNYLNINIHLNKYILDYIWTRPDLPFHPGEENEPPLGRFGTDKQLKSTSRSINSGRLITSCGTITSGSTELIFQ